MDILLIISLILVGFTFLLFAYVFYIGIKKSGNGNFTRGLMKSIEPIWIREMKNQNPVVVATITGEANHLQKVIAIARRYGYEVQNVSQSGMFLDVAKYTVIFKKGN